MSERVVVEADGGSRGNPGPAGYGAVVMDAATGAVLAERKEAIGVETNNVAEYRGLIAGLQAARELGATRVAVRMDSKLVVEQMKGTWQVKHPGLRPLASEAAALRSGFAEISFEWIPRERNKHADRLANEAMDSAAGISRPSRAAPAAPPAQSWTPPSGPRTRLLLVRHGATEHSAALRLSGRNDLPLTPDGEAQAAALAKRDFGTIAAIVSSPLRRARQTAEVIAAELGLPARVDDNFAEVDFGAFEGLTFAEAQAAEPAAFAQWAGSTDVAPPGGESFAALARRVRRGRDAIVAAHPDATVLVVTHVTPIKLLVRAALDAPMAALFHMHLDVATVSALDYSGDGSASLRLFNDASHLTR
ncbi:MAG TPA: bifunctional RNase H/acid phosphatase [Jatrophihabitans sp.]